MARRRSTVQYAKGNRGWVAYEVLGDGPADVVMLPGPISHLDLFWDEPSYATFVGRLAQFSRLVIFDRSGTGLSDPLSDDELTPEQTVDDFRAVMDAAGMEHAAIFGVSGGGCLAALFAATVPERASALVLYGSYARLQAAPDYPWGIAPGGLTPDVDGRPNYRGFGKQNPTVVDDLRIGEWSERFFRSAGSPRVIQGVLRMMYELDVRPILGDVVAPTLVIAREDDETVSVGNSRFLAAHIPRAELVELEGVDHNPWFGDSGAVVDRIEQFLVGDDVRRQRDRNAPGTRLTRREQDVIELMRAGLTAREIGTRLFISARTVETHIAHAYAKLGINSRVELDRRAVELGLPRS